MGVRFTFWVLVAAAASLSSCAEAPPPSDNQFHFGFKENATALVKDLGLNAVGRVGDVGYAVGAVAVPEEWKKGHVYGKWCGAGVPDDAIAVAYSELLVNTQKRVSGNLVRFIPEDGLDRQCMVHDVCYSLVDTGAVLALHQECDEDLHAGIETGIRNGSIPVSAYPISAKILTWVGGASATKNIQIGAEARMPMSSIPQSYLPEVVAKYAVQNGGSFHSFMERTQ